MTDRNKSADQLKEYSRGKRVGYRICVLSSCVPHVDTCRHGIVKTTCYMSKL